MFDSVEANNVTTAAWEPTMENLQIMPNSLCEDGFLMDNGPEHITECPAPQDECLPPSPIFTTSDPDAEGEGEEGEDTDDDGKEEEENGGEEVAAVVGSAVRSSIELHMVFVMLLLLL